jgi:hypothetical protein
MNRGGICGICSRGFGGTGLDEVVDPEGFDEMTGGLSKMSEESADEMAGGGRMGFDNRAVGFGFAALGLGLGLGFGWVALGMGARGEEGRWVNNMNGSSSSSSEGSGTPMEMLRASSSGVRSMSCNQLRSIPDVGPIDG